MTLKVKDLKNHQTGITGLHPVLYCPYCGDEYSANKSDYFMLSESLELVCRNCGVDLVIATKHTVYEVILPLAVVNRPLEPRQGLYIVLVRTDRQPDGKPGRYEVSNKTFNCLEDATAYSNGCSPSRQPFVARIETDPPKSQE